MKEKIKRKIMGNKIIILLVIFNLMLIILPMVNADASVWPAYNVCCEKTLNGAWCQNTLKENCNTNFRLTPTSCESTGFCKPGICYDSSEGLCMDNTPQRVCNDANGTWVDDSVESVPQCNLGCCVLGSQASFVTLTRCKKLSAEFGLQTDFRTNIEDEVSCISIAASQDVGACVYESDYQRTCKFTTRAECLNVEENDNITSTGEFFKDYLCSAEELATNCGITSETMCVSGKDEVYFMDSCGNPANIYDASRKNDKSYWQQVLDKSEACSSGDAKGNAGSKSCGNCDYFKGSICSEGNANYGDYICTDLNCYDTKNGNDYKNGESWCEYQSETGEGQDTVGSRQFRHVCINGEETIEPCADYRNEVCYEEELEIDTGTFIEAACRVNRWQDCIDQDTEEKCLNTDKRDCYWLGGARFTGLSTEETATATTTSSTTFSGGTTTTFSATGSVIAENQNSITGYSLFGGDDSEDEEDTSGVQLGGGACLPNIPPGLKFWSEGDASSVCSLGYSKCIVTYEKKILGEKKCIDGCECLEEGYAQKMNTICTSLGDCGAYVNVLDRFTDDGAEWKVDGALQTITKSIMGG
ncbi:MAG: hypothetical protein WCX73_01180 [Candidatus Pacearchaeota archaeon]|jgi:hypothetical protein